MKDFKKIVIRHYSEIKKKMKDKEFNLLCELLEKTRNRSYTFLSNGNCEIEIPEEIIFEENRYNYGYQKQGGAARWAADQP